MTFRLFSHAAKPSSASGVVAETSSAMGDGEEAEGLKKELIFACIAYRIGIVLRVFLFFSDFGATGILFSRRGK